MRGERVGVHAREEAGQEDEGDSAAKLLETWPRSTWSVRRRKTQAKFRGPVCLCRFSGDGKVYRALVERARQQDGKDSHEVSGLRNRDVVEARTWPPSRRTGPPEHPRR